jgi:two-component system, cell cycle sensor histidine kinase and response regulator CckA
MVAMVRAVLQAQGFRVSGFDSSTHALAFLREHMAEVDLLITDYNMPEMSGLDLAREARALRANLPIIVASGHISAELRDGADEAGVDCLFDKPAGIDELCLRIREQLNP